MKNLTDYISRLPRRVVIGMMVGLSALLTAVLLISMLLYSGVPRRIRPTGMDLGSARKFQMYASNAISDAVGDVMSIEKKYWISRDAQAAPVPDRSKFGETDDPSTLDWLLKDARKLLGGQELYFSTDVEIMPDSVVRYYLDDTILAITWKVVQDLSVYTFSEVKIADPSQFRRFLAGGEYGSGKLIITTEMAQSVNAVVASSGDYYQFRNAGIIVYDGIVRRAANGVADTCYIDYDGNMHFSGVWDYMDVDMAQKFVDENNISFSVAFGPILVNDGKVNYQGEYKLGEVDQCFARAALCQMDDLHYLLATVNNEAQWQGLPNINKFARRISETGCQKAYALDGGQTAVIAMDGELINNVTFGYQRKISDIIYFGTAIPNTAGG